jgi:hypothetical protein
MLLGKGSDNRIIEHTQDIELSPTTKVIFNGDIQAQNQTANRAMCADASKIFQSSTTSCTELDYLTGVTSSVQDQLNERVERGEWLQNGIVDTADSTISFNDGTLTFTINRTGASYDYYDDGQKYTVTTDDVAGVNTVTITDTEGIWAIYYSGSTLTSLSNPTDAQFEDIIENQCIVSALYWDATNNKAWLLDERHGYRMSPRTHTYLHLTFGMQYISGLGLADFVIDDSGNDDEDAQFSIASGVVYDEDLGFTTNTINATTGIKVFYRSGSDWRWTTQTGFKIITFDGTSSTRLAYDNAGVLTQVSNNQFVLAHIFATNEAGFDPITILGQAQYTTISAARLGAEIEISNLVLSALPSQELKPIATVIFQTADAYSNGVKGRTRTSGGGENYVDWRTTAISAGVAAADHGALGGLADDDHTQYYLRNEGTSGSVLFSTGTDVSEDNANFFWDDIDNFLGLGTTDPVARLSVQGTDITSSSICMERYSDDTGASRLGFRKARGSSATPAAVQLDDILGDFQFFGYNGSAFVNGPRIQNIATENWSVGNTGSKFVFTVMPNGGSATIAMTLDQDQVAYFTNDVQIENGNQLQLEDGSGSGSVNIQAPPGPTASWTMTMPPNDGDASQVLTTDGNGVTTWEDGGGGAGGGINFLTDGSFETDVSNVTVNLGSGALSETTIVMHKEKSLKFTGSGSGLDYEQCETDASWYGMNLEVSCYIKSDDNDLQLCSSDDQTDILCTDYDGSDVFKKVVSSINVASTGSGSGTACWRLKHTGTGTGIGGYLDECTIQPLQPSVVTSDDECAAVFDLNGVDCSITSQNCGFVESVNRVSTGICDLTWTSGYYTVPPALQASDYTSDSRTVAFSNVTTSGARVTVRNANGGAVADIDFSIIASSQDIDADRTSQILTQNYDWYVDANIGGANPGLGTSSIGTYTGITNGSLDLVNNSPVSNVAIACAGTEEADIGDTTCSADESVGITFDGHVGKVEACASFQHRHICDTAGSTIATFQLVKTGNADQVAAEYGHRKATSSQDDSSSSAGTGVESITVCGIFDVNGKTTLRVFYEQLYDATCAVNYIYASRPSTIGDIDIHWSVIPISGVMFAKLNPLVYVEAYNNGGETIADGTTDIVYSSERHDTHLAWDGDQFTVPINGVYVFSSAVRFSAGCAARVHLYKGGVRDMHCYSSAASEQSKAGSCTKYFTKDDVVSLRLSGATCTLQNTGEEFNKITITRIGDIQ